MCIKKFAADESGAVTVDWTVMTAAIAGLGIATYGVVSGGISDLSSDVGNHLSGYEIYDGFGSVMSFDNFANGLAGWNVVGTAYDDPEIDGGSGVFLLDQGLFIERSFELDPNRKYAIVEMEIQTIGKFEPREVLNMLVDGQTVDSTSLVGGNINNVGGDGGASVTYTFNGTTMSSDDVVAARLAQYADDPDDRRSSNLDRVNSYTMRMVVENPGAQVDIDLGVSGTGRILADVPGEGVSIGSVRVISTDTP